MDVELWRTAIENYQPGVKSGNQVRLGAARVPFARYLNQIHDRLHPIFSDSFLASLDHLPEDHPLNRPDIVTNVEIVLDKDSGRIVQMGVTQSSGSLVFDASALQSLHDAAPFGAPPPSIVSPDGRVYLHWELYRNPFYACTTYFSHPYLLKPVQETGSSDIGTAIPAH